MSKIKYTESQEEAINYFSSNLLVSASAGSGKTQVLIEKVLKLIEKDVSLNNILMLTFTNLASEEMKIKLEKKLKEKLEETNDPKLEKALNEVLVSDIGTIDGFCQKLVKKFYYKLNIEPNFELLDDNFAFYLKNLTLDNLILEYLNVDDQKFKELINIFIHSRSLNEFKNEVFSYFNFLTSKANRICYLDEIFEKTNCEDINENIVVSFLKDDFEFNTKLLLDELNVLKQNALKIKSEKLINLTCEFINILTFNFKNNEDFALNLINFPSFPNVRVDKATFEEKDEKEKLQSLSKRIKKYVGTIKNFLHFENLSELKAEICENKIYLAKFFEVVKKFEKLYFEEKQKRNSYEFYDIEDFALKLLEDEDVLKYVNEKYKYVFVDEYQDINDIQEEILNRVCKLGKEIMVGDVKQSIYAFRECNPKIFLNKMHGKDKLINLNENFRSNKDILNFSNIIFSNLIRRENMNLNYVENPFVCGKEFVENKNNTLKHVEVIALLKEKNKNEEDNKTNKNELSEIVETNQNLETSEFKNEENEKEEQSIEQKENFLVLNAISELLKQQIYDENLKEFRFLTYSDIAILSRKRGDDFRELVNFLDENKVPVKAKYYDKILKSFEINLILNYLKILSNFKDEISIVSILKNVYFVKFKEIKNLKDGDFFENIKNSKNQNIQEFLNDYYYFKNLAFELNVRELVIEIIEKCKLENLFLKNFGQISKEKISVFLNNVLSDKMNLFEFLENLKNLDFEKKYEVSKVSAKDCVTVDTFHASKGLEYNAVIIYGAGYKILDGKSKNLVYNSNLGTGIFSFDLEDKTKRRSLIYSAILEQNLKNNILEEIRLLYVALTRAKEFLIVIGKETEKNLTKTDKIFDFRSLNSYLSLIFSADIFKENFEIKLISENSEILKTEIIEEEIQNQMDLNFDNFDKIYNYSYKFKDLENIQHKSSVTAISEQEEDENIFNITDFKIYSENLNDDDFLLIGNVYHKTFEMLPFNLKNKVEVENLLNNFVENEIVPADALTIVDADKVLKINREISKFINSDSKIFKEQKFIMKVPYCEVVDSEISEKILVQGTIDLFIENEDEIILIDYKTSRMKNERDLIKRYKTQISLYEKAILKSNLFRNKKIKKYIASVYLSKLIEIE